jgi:POTRA domain, FtsQ-type
VAGQRRAPQSRARTAVVPLPGRARRLAVPAPSRRSLAAGVALLAVVACAYATARHSSAFAIERIDVRGAPSDVQQQVRRTLAPLIGTNLLTFDGSALEQRVEALPTVVAARYDRAFPHVLRLSVVPERPVAVLHRGRETWLVSARGRVIAHIPNGTHAAFARIWVPRATAVVAGGFLAPATGGTAARTLGLTLRFPARIATASLAHGELVFRLRSGIELRFGAPTDVRLKLAIARRALGLLPAGATYVDVSVPGRPVVGADSQLSGRD